MSVEGPRTEGEMADVFAEDRDPGVIIGCKTRCKTHIDDLGVGLHGLVSIENLDG